MVNTRGPSIAPMAARGCAKVYTLDAIDEERVAFDGRAGRFGWGALQ